MGMLKGLGKLLIKYFFQGLLLTAPLVFTVLLTLKSVQWFDSLFEINTPGLGIIIFLISVTFLGFLASTIIIRPLFNFIDLALTKMPFIGIIYTSIKDLFSAFVGNDKKFNKPVLVKMNPDSEIQKIGFITQQDLTDLNLNDKVAVYFPHSYNFSGELFIVPTSQVETLNLPSAEVMKFIVSGGVSGLRIK